MNANSKYMCNVTRALQEFSHLLAKPHLSATSNAGAQPAYSTGIPNAKP